MGGVGPVASQHFAAPDEVTLKEMLGGREAEEQCEGRGGGGASV